MAGNENRLTRAQLKIGSGKGTAIADAHFDEVAGSQDFYIFVPPRAKVKGYEDLKAYLQGEGYPVSVVDNAPMLPAKGFKAIKITCPNCIISEAVLRRAHRWAHQRDFLHSFFKPLRGGRA